VKGDDVSRGDLIFSAVGGKSISKPRGTGQPKAEFDEYEDEYMVETVKSA
jgi:hypothetical protein